jgi:CelD/BcsL family acetyltransferase involved in cellulose biosynthesis
VIRVAVHDRVDLTALGSRWRDLEARSTCAFFLSWTWTGCLIEERFPDPVLVEATEDGRTVALALFNRRRRWGLPVLWLHESGTPSLDCPYIEQNGVLAEAGREAELTRLCLAAVLPRWHAVLSGIDATTFRAVQALPVLTRVRRTQASPFADLARLRAAGRTCRESRSANTRQQLARSVRWYATAADAGVALPEIARAETVDAALAALDSLAALHQASWNSRGAPGSFAQPFFRRFHRLLIERGFALGQVALQKVSFSDMVIGYLYNFRFRNQILAYQSGFHYRKDAAAARPGLVAHAAAIDEAMEQGVDIYDFLAGDDRYKRSLSDSAHQVWWIGSGPRWSPVAHVRTWLDRLKNGRAAGG